MAPKSSLGETSENIFVFYTIIMIKLDIATLVFFYILFSAIFILIGWLSFSYRGAKRHSIKERDYLWKCSVCFHIYVDSRHEEISRCPLCDSYNKKVV